MTKYYYGGQLVKTSYSCDSYRYALIIDFPNFCMFVKKLYTTKKGAIRAFNYYRKKYSSDVLVLLDVIQKVVC